MQREFGKRSSVRVLREVAAQSAPVPEQPARDPAQMRRAVVAIALIFVVVGGMFFVLPSLGQCDGRQGVLGLDWCRLMKATVEGGSRGVAVGRGTTPSGGR